MCFTPLGVRSDLQGDIERLSNWHNVWVFAQVQGVVAAASGGSRELAETLVIAIDSFP
jgi:hypothetical protein